MLWLTLLLNILAVINALEDKCDLCRTVLEKYRTTFHEVDKDVSLGGGNTDWEEKFIGKYEFSELHAYETLEDTLKKLGDHEAHFLTDVEGDLEEFWSDELKTGKSRLDDVVDFLCIKKLELCCPWNHFGPDCSQCAQCNSNNGKCDGNGTRIGTGKCSCRAGFTGELCEKCDTLTHYESQVEEDTRCLPCHQSCSGGCKDDSPRSCVSCAKGYTPKEENGTKICEDIDECGGSKSPCETGAYCVNLDGSYSCPKCPKECASCTNFTTCLSCSSGYTLEGDQCVDVDECLLPEICLGEHKRCVNKPGSYHCVCEQGYRLKGDVCVLGSQRKPTTRRSMSKWNSQRLLIEFGKLLLIVVGFCVLFYLAGNRPLLGTSLVVAALALIVYQAGVLDSLNFKV